MNALIAVIFVLLGTGMDQDVGMFLWAVLASVEWLADRYAGWLWRCCVAGSSESNVRAAIRDITARWAQRNNSLAGAQS